MYKNHSAHKKNSFLSRLQRYFVTGILAVLPILLTLGIFYYLLTFIRARVDFIPRMLQLDERFSEDWDLILQIASILSILTAVTFIGFLVSNFIGRRLLQYGEWILQRIPIIKGVYNSMKQVSKVFFRTSEQPLRHVVILEYPRKGIWALAFVTGPAPQKANEAAREKKLFSVFIPTTPIPTSGYLLMVPEKQLTFLDMTVEQAMKLIMSGGIVRN